MQKSGESQMGQLAAAIVTVTPFQQNCTLLWDDASMKGAVIDPGGELNRIEEAIKETGIIVEKVLLTHGHIDHAGAADALKNRLGVQLVGPHKDDLELLSSIEKQSEMFGVPGDFQNAHPDQWLEEGDVVDIGGHEFEVLHCPGHAPGHVVFYNKAARFAHVGDVLFQGSIGRTDLPGGNHQQLISSIKDKLLALGDDVSFICGHGPGSTLGRERQSNPFLV
jgi:glyoxylase-like metal-dependent hydrolase (beta-lactamase superfamily II)